MPTNICRPSGRGVNGACRGLIASDIAVYPAPLSIWLMGARMRWYRPMVGERRRRSAIVSAPDGPMRGCTIAALRRSPRWILKAPFNH